MFDLRTADRAKLEAESRAACASSYLGDHTVLCRVLGRYLMYVDTRDRSLTPHLIMGGFWESWVTRAIAHHVREGMSCVDAGANLGYYTLVMADLVGDGGHVHAFEPNPRLAQLLRWNVDANGFGKRVTVVEAAVGDRNGKILFDVPANYFGGGTTRTTSGTEVRVVKLDDEFPYTLDFLKADIEGGEVAMLHGMQALWARSPRAKLVLEYTPELFEPPDLPLKVLSEMGVPDPGMIAENGEIELYTHQRLVLSMLWASR